MEPMWGKKLCVHTCSLVCRCAYAYVGDAIFMQDRELKASMVVVQSSLEY